MSRLPAARSVVVNLPNGDLNLAREPLARSRRSHLVDGNLLLPSTRP